MGKRKLSKRDVERLENTSSVLPMGAGAELPVTTVDPVDVGVKPVAEIDIEKIVVNCSACTDCSACSVNTGCGTGCSACTACTGGCSGCSGCSDCTNCSAITL